MSPTKWEAMRHMTLIYFDGTCLFWFEMPFAALLPHSAAVWRCVMAYIPIHGAVKESFSKTYDAHFKNCWRRLCQCWPVHVISEFHCLFLVVEVQKSFSCNRLLRTRLEVHLLKAMAARHGASQQEPSSTWVSYISLFKRSGRIGLDVIWCYQISSTLTFFLETRCWVSSCFIVLQELSDLWLLPSNACGQEQLQHSGELWETWWGDANVALHCVPSWEIAFHSADSLNWLACVLPAIWQIEALTALKKHAWNSEVHCSWVLCTDLLVKGGCTFRG